MTRKGTEDVKRKEKKSKERREMKEEEKKEKEEKAKSAAPGLPAWSPTAVLPRLEPAYLRCSDGKR